MLQCECGLTYVPGEPDDEEMHTRDHNVYLRGPVLPSLSSVDTSGAVATFPLFIIDGSVPQSVRHELVDVVCAASPPEFPAGYDGTVTEYQETLFLVVDGDRAVALGITALDDNYWKLSWKCDGTVELVSKDVNPKRRLKIASGLTFEEIANKLNRSIYWVHTRLRKAYYPQGTRAEKLFQETRVVPFLQTTGHTDIRQYVRVEGDGYSQKADVVSVRDGKTTVTEVKLQITHHQLQTAIGQLILHRLAFADKQPTVHLQIALPEEAVRRKAPTRLVELLAEKEGIDIALVPNGDLKQRTGNTGGES